MKKALLFYLPFVLVVLFYGFTSFQGKTIHDENYIFFAEDDVIADFDSCFALFDYSQTDNVFEFTNQSTTTTDDSIISFLWNFGDGFNSTEENPIHAYIDTGTYSASLSILTIDSCTSSANEEIFVSELYSTGNAFMGSSLLPSGKVYLYSVDTTERKYLLSDYGEISNGFFEFAFSELEPTNTFYVVPISSFPENHYPEYFPTYYGDELYWENADLLYSYTSDTININLVRRSGIFYGNGYISGILDSGQFVESELDGAMVLLLDANQQPLKYVQLNNDHTFEMSHIPFGDYYLLIDKIGIPDKLHPVSLTSSNSSLYVEITMNQTLLSSNSISLNPSVCVYPNPCSDKLTIRFNNEIKTEIPIQITDVSGKVVLSRVLSLTNNKMQVEMSHFSNGFYTVSVLNHIFKVQKD